MARLAFNGYLRILKDNGAVCTDATCAWDLKGTTTDTDTYPTETDADAGTNPNTNPVAADANGVFPNMWLKDAVEYKATIAGTGVTTKTIDGAALSAAPDQYYFHATKGSTDQTGIVDVTDTKITFTTESYDGGGYYDAANSKWTPPAGAVRISAGIYFTGTIASAAIAKLHIYKNGSVFKTTYSASASTGVRNMVITCVDVADGDDYYEVYGQCDVTGTVTANGAQTNSWFEGEVI